MADKHDTPRLFRISDKRLCECSDEMHFIRENDARSASDNKWGWRDAGRWLGIAERMNMVELKTKCQSVIMRDLLASFASNDVMSAMAALQGHGVKLKSVCEIATGLVHVLLGKGEGCTSASATRWSVDAVPYGDRIAVYLPQHTTESHHFC